MKTNSNILAISMARLVTLIFLSTFVLISCNKNRANTQQTIAQNRAVPVKILVVQPQKFEETLSFYSRLTGIIENTRTSMVADRIERIRVRPGQFVKEKQIVIEFPTDNPSLQFQQAKAAYENALKNYNRMKELLKTGEVSQQNFDNVETQYLVAKRNYEALKQVLFVEAPTSGYVSSIYVTEGQQIDIGKPLFTVSVLNKMRAVTWANEQEIQKLKIGMNGKILWNGKEYPCKIISLGLKMDEATKGFRVEFEAPNPNLELKSGVTVEIQVQVYENPNAIVIPTNLIEKDPDGKPFVFVEKDGIAIKKYVKIGRTSKLNSEIIDGLSPNEHLIVEGNHLLSENSKVFVIGM